MSAENIHQVFKINVKYILLVFDFQLSAQTKAKKLMTVKAVYAELETFRVLLICSFS